ncbi:hypothetical protein E2C01_023253 [Portunus trituberculatus]|uniref:Uncharacterized protein n=1 Tax=Portunus trituberculatus TaxID=210409 RepID=A0A5B7E9A1_PORTR|nr:hypothetical protein [Portunus trituberculatus]
MLPLCCCPPAAICRKWTPQGEHKGANDILKTRPPWHRAGLGRDEAGKDKGRYSKAGYRVGGGYCRVSATWGITEKEDKVEPSLQPHLTPSAFPPDHLTSSSPALHDNIVP